MPRQTEPSANNALGGLLQAMLPRRDVRSENTRAIAGRPGLRPDILVTGAGRSPVVIEAEYVPARNAEAEATSRLGLALEAGGHTIEAAIALRYPDELGDARDLREAVGNARLSYCLFTQEREGVDRFPESGWLGGSVSDLADLVRLVAVPAQAVDRAATALQQGISDGANRLDELDKSRTGITMQMARRLGMANVPQTLRMACAIIANALVFHERFAGMHPGIKPLGLVCGPDVANPQEATLAAWNDILEIDYWPIFGIARDLLRQLPSGEAAPILRLLMQTAQAVDATGIDNAHDLTGRIFQRLIADRKYLATFYTLPASAALLARLAVEKMDVDWSDAGAIGNLRIGDFACGTGALLSAVYEQIAARHERAEGDLEQLHRIVMEEVLYGCDVMPSAIHITGSTLSGAQPNVSFGRSRLYTMPYGRQEDGTVKIGSLELLQSSAVMTLFNTSDPALRTGSVGEETATQINVDMQDEGFDLVIMNPPFTRATNHGGGHARVVNPAFAAYNASAADQTEMGRKTNKFGRGTCYNGNAGMASAFAALAHRKLKPGGVLALVLPLVATGGLSWRAFRQMLANEYEELTILSIAAEDINDMSFSADTGLGECLVIARKVSDRRNHRESPINAEFVSLRRRPQGFAHSAAIASSVLASEEKRDISDGPYGGTSVKVGDELAGELITAPCEPDGGVWGAVRLADASVAQTAHALSQSVLQLPGVRDGYDLPVSRLGTIARLGLVDRDITGPQPRGPFDKMPPSETATYPSLWNHNARAETRIVCLPDSQLIVRQGMEVKAVNAWETVSRSHLNRDFRFNSQPLTVAFTERESMGGRAWPNVRFEDRRLDYTLAIWGNSTLGMLMHWWHSSRQDSGRGTTTIRSLESLPVLDFRALSEEQLATAEKIFDEFRDEELQPAYLADADPNRALLDRRVVCELLGFDEDTYAAVRRLAAKWCAEPSVHGGKKRPPGAALVV